jgi:hypothetical protein
MKAATESKLENSPEVKAAITELALSHASRVIGLLMDIAETSDSDTSRVTAMKEILDRGLGKALVDAHVTAEGGIINVITGVPRRGDK